jgi:hypothetical protein
MKSINLIIITIVFVWTFSACKSKNDPIGHDTLEVSLSDSLDIGACLINYSKKDTSGNTSVAFDAENIYKWSGESVARSEDFGYYNEQGEEVPYIKRDRDLGQTFLYNESTTKKLKAVTVRLGFGTNVVRPEMYGKAISIQLFEVSGTPVLNKNNSDTIEAFHGFQHNRKGVDIPSMRDDYFTGEVYKSLAVISGANFPSKSDFGFKETDSIAPSDKRLKGKYLTFTLPTSQRINLVNGKTYAFVIMIDKIGKNQGFTLANSYVGDFPGGHGLRRDGNGIFPPVPPNPMKDFNDAENKAAMESAHFPDDFSKRCQIQPGTNGYPDVCTWRDLVFCIGVE